MKTNIDTERENILAAAALGILTLEGCAKRLKEIREKKRSQSNQEDRRSFWTFFKRGGRS